MEQRDKSCATQTNPVSGFWRDEFFERPLTVAQILREHAQIMTSK